MVALGNKYKNTQAFTGNYKIVYFTMVGGNALTLNEEQLLNIRNDWLIINTKTRRRTNPFDMPEAGHFTKKKDAKNTGIPIPGGALIIWEIKIKPEFANDFKSLVLAKQG